MGTERDQEVVEANRAAWDAAAPHHKAAAQWRRLTEGFAQPGFSCFDEVGAGLLREAGVEGSRVAQLCCNNGRELISACNLGAASGVGFDQSAAFLAQARELNAIAGRDCRFVEAEVLSLPDGWDGGFDLVFTTIGVFGWLPDLRRFFVTVARLLKPGAVYLAYEEHPILNMLEPTEGEDPNRLVHSYFKEGPFAEAASLDYFGNARYEAPLHHWFSYKISDILTAMLDAGLVLEAFREYPHNLNAEALDVLEKQPAQLPLSFAALARKPA